MPAGGGPRRRRRRGATMAKILCVLYPDPVEGYPSTYPRADIPVLERYPNGQMLPTPKDIDFTPGQLLGSVSGELDLRKFLESQGHTLVVTCLLYTSDAADDLLCVDLGGRRIIKNK